MHTLPESPAAEPVLAVDVERGDVLVYDGRQLTVTAAPEHTRYYCAGRPVLGLVIACSPGGHAQWFLYRSPSSLLFRVRRGRLRMVRS